MKRSFTFTAVAAGALAIAAYTLGFVPAGTDKATLPAGKAAREAFLVPAVTVAPALAQVFVDTVLVTGTLVARQEILIAPEVEGLRVTDLAAEEGDRVRKGDLLARLEQETLTSQLAQNSASTARAAAAIAQAQSQIVQAEARLAEAAANFERAQPLKKSGALSEAVFDQRQAAARTAEAQLAAARDGLKLAQAELGLVEAQRRELTWRLSRTAITAPADGLITRRSARVGGVASAAGEPMFRLAAAAEVELEAEVPESEIERLRAGLKARVVLPGGVEISGLVRIVSPEVDRTTRLGKARILLGSDPRLRVGSFGRGSVDVATSTGLSIPASAVVFATDGAHVLVVKGDIVETRRIRTGLTSAEAIEVTQGLAEGDLVVAKAGTFLRTGDRVRPVRANAGKISEAQ
jgi:HlyD family secretion protein